MYTPVDFFTLYGNLVPLNIYAPAEEMHKDLIKRIEHIISEYRNPSAHIGIIDLEKATIFYNEFKICITYVNKCHI